MAFNYNAGYAQYPQSYNYASVQSYQTPQSGTFVWVQGEAGAKSYPVAPGNRIALFDSENPVVYIKSVDYNGRPSELEIYDLVKREPVKTEPEKKDPMDLSSYITRDEIQTLIASSVAEEVDRAISEISLKPTSKKRKEEE